MKQAPPCRAVCDLNFTIHCFQQAVNDVQPQPVTVNGLGIAGVRAEEAGEEQGHILFGDALALVLHADPAQAVLAPCGDQDFPIRGVFQGVVQQVEEHAGQGAFVGQQLG